MQNLANIYPENELCRPLAAGRLMWLLYFELFFPPNYKPPISSGISMYYPPLMTRNCIFFIAAMVIGSIQLPTVGRWSVFYFWAQNLVVISQSKLVIISNFASFGGLR